MPAAGRGGGGARDDGRDDGQPKCAGNQPDTRQRILVIAADLFTRQGYTGTSIADIARELRTTTAALYYHVPSKSAILSQTIICPNGRRRLSSRH